MFRLNDHPDGDPPGPPPEFFRPPDAHRRRFPWWALAIPLLVCGACFGLMVYALLPMGFRLQRTNVQPIPVTGEQLERPTDTPKAGSTPGGKSTQPGQPTLPPGGGTAGGSGGGNTTGDYRLELDQRLSNCTDSFHAFLEIQQSGFSDPTLFDSHDWRLQALDASTAFDSDCKSLGSLPNAPSVYQDVDRYLKQAAAEVGPTTDSFNSMLSDSSTFSRDKARSAMAHMLRFIQYTQQAEDALSGIKEMRIL